MPRTVSVPAQVLTQDIRSIEEHVTSRGMPGFVRVMVGVMDEHGAFVVPQQYETYEIRGKMYETLTGPAGEWAPDKPNGTFRNDDLWYFIDKIKDAQKKAADLQREME